MGLGVGAVTAVTEIIVTEMVPLRLRGKWLALISVAWAAGTVSGPLQGGLLADATEWSWVRDLRITTCVLAACVDFFFFAAVDLRHHCAHVYAGIGSQRHHLRFSTQPEGHPRGLHQHRLGGTFPISWFNSSNTYTDHSGKWTDYT